MKTVIFRTFLLLFAIAASGKILALDSTVYVKMPNTLSTYPAFPLRPQYDQLVARMTYTGNMDTLIAGISQAHVRTPSVKTINTVHRFYYWNRINIPKWRNNGYSLLVKAETTQTGNTELEFRLGKSWSHWHALPSRTLSIEKHYLQFYQTIVDRAVRTSG